MKKVAKSDMEKPRIAQELLLWVETTFDEIGNTKEGVSALRFLKGTCKQLAEEIFPLALWASKMDELQHFTIEPKIGSQNYDAFVSDGRDPEKSFHVEITLAHKGEQEYARRVFLAREGWAPGPALDLKKSGTKARGQLIEARRILTNLGSVKRKSFQMISDAVQRKLEKIYPSDTRLLIAFEDIVIARDEGINDQLHEVVQAATLKRNCPFTHIYLVGLSGRLLISWEREAAAAELPLKGNIHPLLNGQLQDV
jgi:hypothetical protein